MSTRESYEKLLVQEKGHWRMVTGILISLGECQFCGHASKNGYDIENGEGKRMSVGTDCVFVLCNIEPHQQRAIKHLEALKKNAKKHEALIQKIKNSHDFISYALFMNWIDEKGVEQIPSSYLGREGRRRMDEGKEAVLCKLHGQTTGDLSKSKCAACVGAAIIYKATKTTNVNPFWINLYNDLTKVKP